MVDSPARRCRPLGRLLALVCILLWGSSLTTATEVIRGVIVQVPVPACADHCGDYYLLPDSTFTYIYATGVDLSPFVDQHVEATGTRSSCGGCIAFIITQIAVIPEDGVQGREPALPLTTRLEQNSPNPFNPSTELRYFLSSDGLVTLRILNVLGETVETIVAAYQRAGAHAVSWNAPSSPSGIYFCMMVFDGGPGRRSISTMKMVLAR